MTATTLAPRPVDLHADDHQARADIITQLADLRRAASRSLADLANTIGGTEAAVWRSENSHNPKVSTLQILARANHHRLILTPNVAPGVGVEDPRGLLYAELAATAVTGEQRDSHDRARVLARLVAARRWLDLDQATVAARMGCRTSALSTLENGHYDPLLSTYQRYARALGGHLDLFLQPDEEN